MILLWEEIELNERTRLWSVDLVFFWLVSLPKGRYRRQAPYADVSETLGLRGGPKTAQFGQKWPKMTSRERKSIKPSKIAK